MSFTPAPTPAPNDGAEARQRSTRERRFARRIECDGHGAQSTASPARGGGLREPDAWHAHRAGD
jgi:hypothetical protein